MERRNAARRVKGAAAGVVVVVVGVAGCATPRVAEVYPQVAEYEGREIEEVSFVDPAPFSADSLDTLTETEATSCSIFGILPFCFRGIGWGYSVGRVDMRTVGGDLGRLNALYRQEGYFGTEVVPEIDEVGEDDGPVHVRFLVRRGDGIVLDSVVVQGTEGIADPDSLERHLPLQAGELLDLREFLASADTVAETLRRRGHAYAEVLRNYAVDTIQDRATVWLLAVPGPRVVVDSIVIAGTQELGRTDALRQLTFSSGDLLRLRDLRASQRNLYELDLVRFASVTVAGDTLQLTPDDSTTATVRVVVEEGPEHVVEASGGFGTVDCVRGRGQWTDRSVFGGGRKLTLTGGLSRIGAAGAGGAGICGGSDDPIVRGLDFQAAADFTQPYFLSPRNQLTGGVFAERQSDPRLYQRTAIGARANMTHRFRPREIISGGVSAEYRRMEAKPELYCIEFTACESGDFARFREGRFRNALNTNWVRDRGNSPLNPTSGHVLRASTVWSSSLLGSDYDFLRANVEAAFYRPLGPGWVVGAFGRLGSFITGAEPGPDNLIPPEERFFAGGASSVRGYNQSLLGPGLYVFELADSLDPADIDPESVVASFVPTGGTSVAVLSLETRFPSPFLTDVLRLAAFVDAGTVGVGPIWELSSQWRVTPGAGLRVNTPVGPIRVDVGYNWYDKPTAPLYVLDQEDDSLVRVADDAQNPPASIFERFTLHIAVGQAF